MAAQIIPTDETPGAREAGVVYFVDRALTTFDVDQQPLYSAGLRELPQTFRVTDREQATLVTCGGVSYQRMVGDGTTTYTGSSWRFHEVDFRERSHWGEYSGTALADWPITLR